MKTTTALDHTEKKGFITYFVGNDNNRYSYRLSSVRTHRGYFRLSVDGKSVEGRTIRGRNTYRICSVDSLIDFEEVPK